MKLPAVVLHGFFAFTSTAELDKAEQIVLETLSHAKVQTRCQSTKQGVARSLTVDAKIEHLTGGFYRLRACV